MRVRSRRDFLYLGVALPFAVLLAACGAGGSTAPSPETSPVAAAQPTSAGATAAPSATAVQAAASAAGSGTCVLAPEVTEGPYYIDEGLVRSDITEGKAGLPLQLNLAVQTATTCKPIANATVELWHCDADGVYSGYSGAQTRGHREVAGHRPAVHRQRVWRAAERPAAGTRARPTS